MGFASLNIQDSYSAGQSISGVLNLGLTQGELLPADSKLIISQNGQQKEFLISDLISANETGNYYVKVNGTAAVPGDTTNGSASELNPMGYKVNPGDVISVIAPAACVITMAYYR